MKYTHMIWDWNGTLLDDVEWCVDVGNRMLRDRGMRPMENIAAYREIFGFPVIDFYRRMGYDFQRESFEALSAEYIELYHQNDTGHCALFPDAPDALRTLRERGVRQVILSASKRENLFSQVRSLGIEPYFDEILGIEDIYARGKVEVGLAYLLQNAVGRAILIGDTAHDYEVARALDIDCLLIARGHQCGARLAACGVPVLDDLASALEYVL